MPAQHPFVALSPEVQRSTITSFDLWPVSSVAFDLAAGRLLLTGKHHLSKVRVAVITATAPMEGSVALWWASMANQFLALDHAALVDRAPNFTWVPYHECIDELVSWASRAGHQQRTNLVHAAAAHVAEYGDNPLRNCSFANLLLYLPGKLTLHLFSFGSP